MKTYRKILKKINELESISCDVCGFTNSFVIEQIHSNEIISIKYQAGYGAEYFEDGDLVELDICTKCLKEKFGNQLRIQNKLDSILSN